MKRWEKKRINYIRRKARRILKQKQKRKKRKIRQKQALPHINSKDKLLRFLRKKKFNKSSSAYVSEEFPDTEKLLLNNPGKKIVITIPEVFSFIENPEETIRILKSIVAYGNDNTVTEIHFDHSNCKELGMCASTIMDILVLKIKKSRKINLSGKAPKEGRINEILQLSGILNHLGIGIEKREGVEKLELLQGIESDEGATKVVEYFLRCLKTQKLTLTKLGLQKFSEMTGEVINNCKLHGGKMAVENKEWYAIGHYSNYEGKKYGECSLVIMNFGNTIHESLKLSSKEMLDSLKEAVKRRRKLYTQRWKKETLWTLYALQDGVSRFRTKDNPDRGTGTIKLIDSFQAIGNTIDGQKPRMSITSGNTHIYFNGKYKLGEKIIGGEIRHVIAFNEENDLRKDPDFEYVKYINEYFPGTVISMNFYIDGDFIRNLMED